MYAAPSKSMQMLPCAGTIPCWLPWCVAFLIVLTYLSCHGKNNPTQSIETLRIPNNKHLKSYRSHKHYRNCGYGLVWDRHEIDPNQAVEYGQLAIVHYNGELDLSSLKSCSCPTVPNSSLLICLHSHRNSLTVPQVTEQTLFTAAWAGHADVPWLPLLKKHGWLSLQMRYWKYLLRPLWFYNLLICITIPEDSLWSIYKIMKQSWRIFLSENNLDWQMPSVALGNRETEEANRFKKKKKLCDSSV